MNDAISPPLRIQQRRAVMNNEQKDNVFITSVLKLVTLV